MSTVTLPRASIVPARLAVISGLIALAALAGLAGLSIAGILPPGPRPADAPADQFSAGRAFAHDERIAAQTHVLGSPANDAVRDYLVTTLRGLGLQTDVQDTVGASSDEGPPVVMARVRNVVAMLPGTAPTGRVFLVAHYDSVQNGPGGSDDGAGSSTLLETARALIAGTRPRNDIVFVFTDAEEACLCGAEAFATRHPLAAGGGVVLNLEARGSGGPVIMFETSVGNAALVDVYGASAPHPVGTSFAVEVYRILPNDTDLTEFLAAKRFTGLNSAYIDGSAVYHTPEDTPSNMDQGSLQHHGDNALALARAFGGTDLAPLAKPAANDATYFPVPGLLVRYAGWLVWPFAALALIAVGVLAWGTRRQGLTSWPRALAGLGLALVPMLLAPVAAQVLWLVLVAVRPGYGNMIDPWRPGWFRVAMVALVAFILLGWYALLRRRFGGAGLAIGGLGWLALLGLVLAALTPGGSYLAALPALAGATAGIVALSVRPAWGRLLSLTVGAAVAVLILVPTVLLFFPALGLETGGAPAFFAVLLGFALLPVLEWVFPQPDGPSGPRRRWWSAAPAALCGVLAIVALAAGLVVDRFDATHPEPAQLMYALDADTGQARWVSTDARPGAWTRQFVRGHEDLATAFGVLPDGASTGPAEAAPLPAPELQVVADTTQGGQRTLILTLLPQRSVRLAYLEVQSGPRIVSATVAGRPVEGEPFLRGPADRFAVLFHAPPDEGITLRLVLDEVGQLTIRAMDGSDGLADLPGYRPRPPGTTIKGSHSSELVLVAKTFRI
jgi:hypothetical protein